MYTYAHNVSAEVRGLLATKKKKKKNSRERFKILENPVSHTETTYSNHILGLTKT